MALNDETEISLMAKLEEVPEDSTSSASVYVNQVHTTPTSSDNLSALDSLTVDLYNALNGISSAEKQNIDLRDKLKACHDKIRELTIFEENLKDQVSVNQMLCVEREQAISERDQALAELKTEKNTIPGWCEASEKVDKIIQSQQPIRTMGGIGCLKRKQILSRIIAS